MQKSHFSFVERQQSLLQVAAVVTQPGKKRNDKPRKPLPVEVLAAEWLSPEQILCPETASNVSPAVSNLTCILHCWCMCACILHNHSCTGAANFDFAGVLAHPLGALKASLQRHTDNDTHQ